MKHGPSCPRLHDPNPMIRVASYNIHKAIGLDRRRNPERTLTVLREINADIVALQEADRRFGSRAAAIPPLLIRDHSKYRPVPLDTRPDSIGWHGNALLVSDAVVVARAGVIPLPTLEPRGAIWAEIIIAGRRLRIVGMHLDLSGIRRRQQIRAIIHHLAADAVPTVMMGDLNEWSTHGGALREFGPRYRVLSSGKSFHTRNPVAQLDRIIVDSSLTVGDCGVHHSAAAARASDHLPIWADVHLPK
jgi:endonuclease/exonuclease/phosphatase family metal-dependent hydrolase